MIFVPLAVPRPLASRQRPECTPVMVPLALRFHCWLAPPVQSQITAGVPLAVPQPDASRHLVPYTISCLPEVYVQDCWDWPLQSYSWVWVPLVVETPVTSRHRPDGTPTIAVPDDPP